MTVSATGAATTAGPLAATAGSAGAAGAAGAAATRSDHDMFLQLLVAQLKYQDPMNPTDSSQFMSQNAQFTSLEKMQDIADSMQQLLTAQMSFGAAGMIGKQITYADADGALHTGTATGVNFTVDGPTVVVDGETVPVSMITTVATPTAA